MAPVRLRLLQGGIKGSVKDLDTSNTELAGLQGTPRGNAITCFFLPSEGWGQEACGRGGLERQTMCGTRAGAGQLNGGRPSVRRTEPVLSETCAREGVGRRVAVVPHRHCLRR